MRFNVLFQGFAMLLMLSPAEAALSVTITRITTNTEDQLSPAIYGDRIAYEDYRFNSTNKADIYLYDIPSATETPYAFGAGEQVYPALWQNLVAWADNRPGVPNAPRYDIFVSPVLAIQTNITNDSNYEVEPSISNNMVFFERWGNNSGSLSDILGYNWGTLTGFSVSAATAAEYSVSGGWPWVAWQSLNSVTDDFDVWAKNLVTGEQILVAGGPKDQASPNTDGRYVVYYDTYGVPYGSRIFLFDLLTRTKQVVSSGSGSQLYPSVSGNLVVWDDNQNIWGYDLATGQSVTICDASGRQFAARVNGNRVVWQDQRNGDYDIYMATVTRDWTAVNRIADAKMLPDDSAVSLSGKIVTANFGPTCAVSEGDRSSGVMLSGSWDGKPGDVVSLSGVMKTVNGQRLIMVDKLQKTGEVTPLKPLGMNNRTVGGEGISPNVPDITGATVLHNVGLLVRVWGRVTASGTGYFYVDDGSGLQDGSNTGLRVETLYNPPAIGKYVSAQGISSARVQNNDTLPVIVARDGSDVAVEDE